MTYSNPRYEVIADSGVYVHPDPLLVTEPIRVAEKGEILEALEQFDVWIRTSEGFVMNEPYILQRLDDVEDNVQENQTAEVEKTDVVTDDPEWTGDVKDDIDTED